MHTSTIILAVVGLLVAAGLIFVFGMLFAKHNAKKAQATQNGVNHLVGEAREIAEEIIAKAKQAAKNAFDKEAKE